jgi:hypothetical protein
MSKQNKKNQPKFRSFLPLPSQEGFRSSLPPPSQEGTIPSYPSQEESPFNRRSRPSRLTTPSQESLPSRQVGATPSQEERTASSASRPGTARKRTGGPFNLVLPEDLKIKNTPQSSTPRREEELLGIRNNLYSFCLKAEIRLLSWSNFQLFFFSLGQTSSNPSSEYLNKIKDLKANNSNIRLPSSFIINTRRGRQEDTLPTAAQQNQTERNGDF